MPKRSWMYINSVVFTVSILFILILVNLLSSRHPARLDLTESKEFTLANSTKRILGQLDDILNLTVYFSKKLPPDLMILRRQVYDLLDEYKTYGKGNFQIESVDPGEDPEVAQKIRFLGIPQLQVNIIEKDQAQLTNVYLGMAVMYSDRNEIIPVVGSVDTLEYRLTSAILKVTRDEPKTVGILTEYGPHKIDDDYSMIKRFLEQEYRVLEINLKEGKELPDEVDTLVVAGCKEIDDEAKFGIDQFVMRGGKAVFLIDPIEIEEGTLQAVKIDSHLDDLLEGYGIKVNHDLVLDRSNAMASFSSGFVQFHVPYPFWLKVLKRNFAQDQPIVSELESLVLPWTSSLETAGSENDPVKTITLAKSTPYAWRQKGHFNLNPRQGFRSSDLGSFSLAMLSSGKFKSLYSDKEMSKSDDKDAPILEESDETQVVVIGNSNFMANWCLRQFGENEVFFMNVIDWLTLGGDLIGIRSRGVTDRPLRELSDKQKAAIRFLNIFTVPALVGTFGLIRFYLKRRRKAAVYGI